MCRLHRSLFFRFVYALPIVHQQQVSSEVAASSIAAFSPSSILFSAGSSA